MQKRRKKGIIHIIAKEFERINSNYRITRDSILTIKAREKGRALYQIEA